MRVLEPVRRELTPRQWRRLRAALALTVSVDAVVVLKDVCGLEKDEDILGVLRWAALAMLDEGLRKERPLREANRKS